MQDKSVLKKDRPKRRVRPTEQPDTALFLMSPAMEMRMAVATLRELPELFKTEHDHDHDHAASLTLAY